MIVAVSCAAGNVSTGQSDPASASCAASPPLPGPFEMADASGTVAVGAVSGAVAAWTNNGMPIASSQASFTEEFTTPTTLTWNVNVVLDGDAYVAANLGGRHDKRNLAAWGLHVLGQWIRLRPGKRLLYVGRSPAGALAGAGHDGAGSLGAAVRIAANRFLK